MTWRFGRTFNFNHKSTGSNFYALASIGALSQTGNYYALTSMGLGTMGSTAGSNLCDEGFSWAKSFHYANEAQITPYSQSANWTFSAICSGTCTSGNTEPVWSQDGVSPVARQSNYLDTPHQGKLSIRYFDLQAAVMLA